MIEDLDSLGDGTNIWFLFSQIIEMIVHMDCAGCESKIKKALNKLDGMLNWTSVFINLFGFV